MKKIAVLGSGMVGRAIAVDLAKNHHITAIDSSEEALSFIPSDLGISKKRIRLEPEKDNIVKHIKGFDLVISAVPGHIGFSVASQVIEAGYNLVDISFMPEDFMQLNAKAKSKGVTMIADCGVAPGMPNLFAGYYYEKFSIDSFSYMVGGLPKKRYFPFDYKAPFSPIDVLEEYTRPARQKINQSIVVKPPMSEPEIIHFEPVGDLEAFNTDGLRSLLFTLPKIKNMTEKTLRYPGHIDKIKFLQQSGFMNVDPIQIHKTKIRPIDFTAHLLFDQWKSNPEEDEFTIMQIHLKNDQKHIVIDLYDEYDKQTKTSSMARTTGYTATAAANLLLDQNIQEQGVLPMEFIGKNEKAFSYILKYLENRNVFYRISEQ